MNLARLTGSLTRRIEETITDTTSALFDPVIRLGVTGLSRAGKTVFITSLVANLIDRGRMPQLRAAAENRILAAYLQPQPDHTIPRFAFEDHLAALAGPDPHWPRSTRSVSTLRLSLKVRPAGFFTALTGTRTVHLDIIDYPGEWLLDLPLMSQDFKRWSAGAIALARTPGRDAHSGPWRALLDSIDPAARLDEPSARALAQAFTAYLAAARAAGLSSVAPGRFLMPGDLEGSPALTFSPLTVPDRRPGNSLWRAFEKRFDAYKRVVVAPFFRTHFARLDRQIVLVDALGAIHDGPRAVEDLRAAMAEILSCFRPGANSWLAPLLGHRIDRILSPPRRRTICITPSMPASPRSPKHSSPKPASAPISTAPPRGPWPSQACAPPSSRPSRGRAPRSASSAAARWRPARKRRSFPVPSRSIPRPCSPPPGRGPRPGSTPPTASPASRHPAFISRRAMARLTSALTALRNS